MNKTKVYFPNLNGIRFIAASLVIIHHVEQLASLFGMESYYDLIPWIEIIGKLGVVLFFVLSGFLITFLLLTEEASTEIIQIKHFYIRRILRIWPLYFLIVTLAFLILPNIPLFIIPEFGKDVVYQKLWLNILLFATFFPNIALSVVGKIPYASHTWSIGTEEQFYLVWPVILKYIKKNRIQLMFFIIFSYLAFWGVLNSSFSHYIPFHMLIKAFWSRFNIDCMAIGGLYAVFLFEKHKVLRILLNPYFFYTCLISVISLISNGIRVPYVHYECYSILFGVVILNMASNTNFKNILENKLFNELGNISYGLYMYHPITIVLTFQISKWLDISTKWFIYPMSVLLTMILAWVSYTYFERFFLKFKAQFSSILSGKSVK